MYQSLLLSEGKGIRMDAQKMPMATDAVHLLIGLGGTGIDCLKRIKYEVYDRLKPDDPEGVTPYRRVRFLGIDTELEPEFEDSPTRRDYYRTDYKDRITCEDRKLRSEEYLCVASAGELAKPFPPDPEGIFSWFRWRKISGPDWGRQSYIPIRQVDRYLFMRRTEQFLRKVRMEISYASGGVNTPIYVHLFSGLSGGTGGGIFLDVCYLLRFIREEFENLTILGYFFLPDVNLSRFCKGDSAVEYLMENGYAAMQELDYCMNLPKNGGAFEQKYPGIAEPVQWNQAPVDLCHVVSGTDSRGMAAADPYGYAMSVTAEYVLNLLVGGANAVQGLCSYAHSCANIVDSQKVHGVNVHYHSIGASVAKLPLREINTYLASVLFWEFEKTFQSSPSGTEMREFLYSVLTPGARSLDEVYDLLYREIWGHADESYEDAPFSAVDAKNAGVNNTLQWYNAQTANKTAEIQFNRRNMESETNENSLIRRIQRNLEPVLKDIHRGPHYVACMFNAAFYRNNLPNLLDGLREVNSDRMREEKMQDRLRIEDYETARADFENRNGLRNRRRYEAFEWYTAVLEQHRVAVAAYEEMGGLLAVLKQQMEKIADYYSKLDSVLSELCQTFRANYDCLTSYSYWKNRKASCTEPIIEFDDFWKKLDIEIYGDDLKPGMDFDTLFKHFIECFLENDSAWAEKNEAKISRLVSEYLARDVLAKTSARTITDYLEDRYEVYGKQSLLAQRICADWMYSLNNTSHPLFQCNSMLWPTGPTSLRCILVPSGSAPVYGAAQMWAGQAFRPCQIFQSFMEDRISVVTLDCAFPLAAYGKLQEFENFYAGRMMHFGKHSYEGRESRLRETDLQRSVCRGSAFDDWRWLPSLIPQSLISLEEVPRGIAEITRRGRETYERAVALGLLTPQREILEPESLDELRKAVEDGKELLENLTDINGEKDIMEIRNAKDILDHLKQEKNIRLRRSGLALRGDGSGNPECWDWITEDYLVSSPALCIMLQNTMEEMNPLKAEAEQLIQELEEKISHMA